MAVVIVFVAALLCVPPEALSAGEEGSPGPVGRGLANAFSMDTRALVYGIAQRYAETTQNPSNDLLQMPRYLTALELRPDARLDLDPLRLSVNPRARFSYRSWQDGCRQGDAKWDVDWFVNEWLARWNTRPGLFLSYGRENLQWGPSFLFSPSNPYFQDNGRRNPYLEVPGMDFARAVWIPHASWTLSLIANTDEGWNRGVVGFERTYSAKLDYAGREDYASLILSRREEGEGTLGFFGGRTISDALLVYGEGNITRGSRAFYPVADGTRMGASMERARHHDTTLYPALVAGGSYTFETRGTLTVEYGRYAAGLSESEADRYYSLRRRAAQAMESGGPASAAGRKVLGQMTATGLRWLRRNYGLFQYTQSGIRDVMDCTLRWTQNLDDLSGQFTSILVYYVGTHLELFSVAGITAGGKNTEFGSTVDYQWMLGVKFTL